MYLRTAASVTAPTVAAKSDRLHSVGNRERKGAISCRRNRDVAPLKRLTISATERVGSAATNRCTWSGITSISCTTNPYSVATALTSSFSRRSTGGTSTGRRYLEHHTTWYFRLNTTPAFLA